MYPPYFTQGSSIDADEATKFPDSYAKTKMIFHKASEPDKPIRPAPESSTAHPLSDKPFEFKRAEPGCKSPTRPTDNTRPRTARDRTFNEKPYSRPGFYNSNWRQDERSAEGNYKNQRSGLASNMVVSALDVVLPALDVVVSALDVVISALDMVILDPDLVVINMEILVQDMVDLAPDMVILTPDMAVTNMMVLVSNMVVSTRILQTSTSILDVKAKNCILQDIISRKEVVANLMNQQ